MPESNDQVPTLRCECGKTFTPDEAHGIAILGPGYARYSCPACSWTVRSVPPPSAETDGGAERDLTPAIIPINDE